MVLKNRGVNMEEKIDKKTRIKEWIFVIGVIVVVTVASIIAYNYGLKTKDVKEDTTVKEEQATEIEDTSNYTYDYKGKDAITICKENIDLIYNTLLENRKNSWINQYDKEFMDNLSKSNPLASKDEIACDTATFSEDESNTITAQIKMNEEEMPNTVFFDYKNGTSVEYEEDIETSYPIEVYAALNIAAQITFDELSEIYNGNQYYFFPENKLTVDNLEDVRYIVNYDNENDCVYSVNIKNKTYKRIEN